MPSPNIQKKPIILPNGDVYEFCASSFVKRILNNWIDGRKPATRLTDDQMNILETTCLWMPDLIKKLQADAAKPTVYKPDVQQRVDWLVEHCADRRLTAITVTDPSGQPFDFAAGKFISDIIRVNFVKASGRPHIQLTAEQIASIRANCKWIAAAEKSWQASAMAFRPSLDQKVSWLIEHCGDCKPKFAASILIRITESVSHEFRPGSFLNDIRSNFIEGAAQRTHLTEDQLSRLKQQCKWMPTYIDSC